MASSIPPPPFLGPLTGTPVGGQYADWVNLFLLRWDEAQQNWVTLNWGQHPWDSFPSGYYASEHIGVDGNVDWGPHSTVIVVSGRSRPDFTPAPFVLEQPPAAEIPDPRCPPNMWWTGIGDEFSVIGGVTLCSWLPPPPQQVCPEGTYWDPATETCKALPTFPPPPIFPPPPPLPPVSESGQPDPDGDTITFELCTQLWAQTTAIIAAIKGIGGAPGADDSALDALLVNALTTLNATLDSFQKFLANLVAPFGNANPDPVTCAQLTELFGLLIAAIDAGDASIADAVAKAPGADPCVCEQLKLLTTSQADLAAENKSLIDYAVSKGIFEGDLGQIVE